MFCILLIPVYPVAFSDKKCYTNASMKMLIASICKKGGREYNQDYLAHFSYDGKVCLVVCDGLGSYAGSDVASRVCAENVIKGFKKAVKDGKDVILTEFSRTVIKNAHSHVVMHKEKTPEISSSCTTVASVITDFKSTVMSHMGDSRIYFFDGGKLCYQSKDHSFAQLAVNRGECTLRNIRSHPDQNKLLRVLGTDCYIDPDIERIDTHLKPGDAFILCTDGFWEYVYEEEMEEALERINDPKEAINTLEKLLLRRISATNDNYTAIVAIVAE